MDSFDFLNHAIDENTSPRNGVVSSAHSGDSLGRFSDNYVWKMEKSHRIQLIMKTYK